MRFNGLAVTGHDYYNRTGTAKSNMFYNKPTETQYVYTALATAARHPGVAIAIASANFPDQKLAPAAILLYLVLSAILSFPYVMWRKRHVNVTSGDGDST